MALVLGLVCLVSLEYCRWRMAATLSLVPTLMFGFFTLEFGFLPLLLKTISWEPVADRLNAVHLTATAVFLTAVAIILAGYLLDNFWRNSVANRALQSAAHSVGLFGSLDFQRYIAIGCFSMALWLASMLLGGLVAKILFPVSILIFIPFAYLAKVADFSEEKTKLYVLAVYFVGMILLSAAFNARGIAAEAAVVALISLTVGSVRFLQKISPMKFVVVAVLGILAYFFFERFVLAMGVARDVRDVSSVSDLISSTFEIFIDTQRLTEYRSFDSERAVYGGYSENYVDYPLFSRFIGLKFLDNFLFYGTGLPDGSVAMLSEEREMGLVRLLPGPLAALFGIDSDKSNIFSVGDYLYYLYSGVGLGELKTGSAVGDLWMIAGPWFYLPLATMGILALFIVVSSFLEVPGFFVSPLLFVLSWKLFGTTSAVGLAGDSVVSFLSFLFRNYWQFLVAYALSKYICSFTLGRTGNATSSSAR